MRPHQHARDRPAVAALRARRRRPSRRGGGRALTDEPELADLLSAAAHDLRGPLAAAGGFALTLQRLGGLEERQAGFARRIVEACEDLDRLVDDLSMLGRVHGGRFVEAPVEVSLAELAARAVDAAPPTPDGRVPELLAPEDAGMVVVAATALARAVGNLASSALRLAPAQASIDVVASGGGVLLRPLAPDAARGLGQPGRDVRLAAAHAVLGVVGWELAVAGDEARVGPQLAT